MRKITSLIGGLAMLLTGCAEMDPNLAQGTSLLGTAMQLSPYTTQMGKMVGGAAQAAGQNALARRNALDSAERGRSEVNVYQNTQQPTITREVAVPAGSRLARNEEQVSPGERALAKKRGVQERDMVAIKQELEEGWVDKKDQANYSQNIPEQGECAVFVSNIYSRGKIYVNFFEEVTLKPDGATIEKATGIGRRHWKTKEGLGVFVYGEGIETEKLDIFYQRVTGRDQSGAVTSDYLGSSIVEISAQSMALFKVPPNTFKPGEYFMVIHDRNNRELRPAIGNNATLNYIVEGDENVSKE